VRVKAKGKDVERNRTSDVTAARKEMGRRRDETRRDGEQPSEQDECELSSRLKVTD
jgi:hypothetical protein